MPKRKTKKRYFTEETENAIIQYNKTKNKRERDIIYENHILYPFDKLAENVLNTFKFQYFDVPKEDVKLEVVSHLLEKIHMFQEGKGKAFSYFSIIAKNYLIARNNKNYKRYKKTELISSISDSWNPEDNFYEREMNEDYREFKELMLTFWDKNLNRVFVKKRDIQIADAVLELFRRSEHVENFNKKHLYLLIREMTNCKTHYITKVVKTMKEYQDDMLNNFLEYGVINDIEDEDEFWSY
jgi:hypothetical protein